jgi:23S rRNA (adenine1618-N6)-methyltransferase
MSTQEKSRLHPRNKHKFLYDFPSLIKCTPELKKFVSINKYNNETIDFSNPAGVKMLNKALLNFFYGINYWDIPQNYLCPPIPGRADYIHYMADVLASSNNEKVPTGKNIRCLDIGVGANCVYPIIGNKEYGWSFIGSDIDAVAVECANKIISSNPSLKNNVEVRLQKSSAFIFKNIVQENESFDFSICNPPFHSSLAEAQAGTIRKLSNLGGKKANKAILNFGGQNAELWCNGGELEFVSRMINESVHLSKQCFWFSSLISKSLNLPAIHNALEKVNPFEVRTIEMAQGNKVSRIVTWTFLNASQQEEWKEKRWLSDKNK